MSPLCLHAFPERIIMHLTLISGVALRNLECKPRPAVYQTNSSNHINPHFILLHRCNGSIGQISPLFARCVPDKVEKFKIEANNTVTFKKVELEVVNHTSCKKECVRNRTTCRPPFHFDPQSCNCSCSVVELSRKVCKDPRKT